MSREALISISGEADEALAQYLERGLRGALEQLETSPDALCVALVGADQMTRLHERFLGQTEPTDVLSFELEHAPDGRTREGEVVVCIDVAAEEARRRGHAVELELLLYAIHGLLHLCGYDDVDEAGYRRMHAKEDEILRSIGVGEVFARDERI